MIYFYVFQSNNNNQWYFTIRAGNNHPVAQSEGYKSKQDALNTIHLIRTGAAMARVFDASAQRWAA